MRGHTIWTKHLGPQSIVVDSGAHRGEFSRELKRRFGCGCWLVEANPYLAAKLRADGFATAISAALGSSDGKTQFIFRENPEAGGVVSQSANESVVEEVQMISLQTVMRQTGVTRIDLLKLDIEGAEFDVIEKTPDDLLISIGQITVEFHDFLPGFRGRGLFERARQRLAKLGFVCWRMAFRTNGDVLFVNLRTSGLGTSARWTHAIFGRWAMKVCGE